jgi:O-methyltransferase
MSLKAYLKQFSSDAKTRDKAVWKQLHSKAQRHGFEMYKSNVFWREDPAFQAARKQWGDTPGNSSDRVFLLYSTAQALRNVAGDTADVGVRYGSSSFYMLKGMDDTTRGHHIFDSFEGLSAPTAGDLDANQKHFWKKGDIAVGEEVTRQCLSMFTNCHYYKGWIPTRFAEIADKRFAFVHVDVDLYEPTLQTLQFFYERMNSGGAIICDDYGFTTCPGAKKAVDEFFAGRESVIAIPTGQALIIKR